jgi:RNA polymerase sigma-70 factor (ECF subfamily)
MRPVRSDGDAGAEGSEAAAGTGAGGRTGAHARDLALVRRAAGDDPWAAHELAERLACVPAMARSRHAKLGSPLSEDELTDVVQDTLVKLLSKLRSFEGRSSLETWAYGFVVRELYKGFDRLRRRARRVPWSEERIAELADESRSVEGDEYRVVHEQIQAIGPPGSEIIRLKHFQLLTFEQIAEELDMPLGTVKTRYYRSADRLRGLLRPHWRKMHE